MDPLVKRKLNENKSTNMKRKYDTINSPQKAKKQEAYKKTKSTEQNLDYFICKFRNKIKEGPYYICSVCNRLLYKKSVRLLDRNSCSSSVPMSVFTNITSFDKKEYICSTCHSKVIKGKIPCQAVYNDMSVDEIPVELAFLEKLEQILIAQRIVFEKIIVMPKGQQKKVSGAICNVPILFPKGRFGYLEERKIKLTRVKYFNARLLHYSGRFATNSEYLFFAQFEIEQKNVSDSINIALKKIQGQPLTASQIKSDVNKLKSLVCQDQAYLFLRQIPGTPPYWQKFMYEVIAMVKQLGIPTWFMTLSCADLRYGLSCFK